MGILHSVMQSLGIETDDEENDISSVKSHKLNSHEEREHACHHDLASPCQWRNENPPTRSHQIKYLTVKENFAPNGGMGRDATLTPVMGKCIEEGRWIKHYSSLHRILLVGEGDFSFSTCLASAFGWASNMVATSLDSRAFLVKNYGSALSNLVELSIRKCKVMHEINATEMGSNVFLKGMKFDRIIFNFPFAGFFKDLPRETQLRLHRRLVCDFLENAKEMMSENGEIHITHKTNEFHKEWKLEVLASFHRLRLVEAVDFNPLDYPGYNSKCGFGGDSNFNCYPSMTYKFRL